MQDASKPNLLQRTMRSVVRGLFGVDWGGTDPSSWAWQQSWVRGADLLTQPEDVDKPYAQVGPFHRAVSVVARDAASVPWEMFAIDADGEPGDEAVPNHPVLRLFERPNQHMAGNQLFIGSYISKLVFGEYFWYYPDLNVGMRGGPRAVERNIGEIQLLHPHSIRRQMIDGGEIRYFQRERDGMERELNGDRLTHSMRYNPYSRVFGLPLAASIIADLVGYHAAARWNAKFFNEDNGVPTMLLIPGAGSMAKPDDRETFLRRFNQRHGKKRSVGLVPGGWDVKDFGFSQREMDFPELRQFGRDEVLAVAGVPPLIAAYLTRPITYNASEQKELYWDSTINAFVTEEQSVINHNFLPKIGVEERIYPKWEMVRALLENTSEKADVAQKFFAMGFTKRQINDRLELGFDVDENQDADVGYLPFNLMPVDMIGMDRVDDGEEVADEDIETDEGGGNGEMDEEEQQRGFDGGLRERRRALVWRNLIVRTRDLESRFDSVIRGHFNAIETEVMANLSGVKGWLVSVAKQDESAGVVLLMFDLEKAKRNLQRATNPLHREAMKRGGESLLFDLAAASDFNLNDPIAVSKLAELTGRIVRIDDTVEHALRVSLVEGVNAGESTQQLAARVRDVMDASKARSFTIARTETGFAFNTGRVVAMQQEGIERHEWLSARDPRVRDDHRAEDGVVVRIGQPFPRTGLQYPLDPSGPPSQIINCRCAAVPVLEE